MGILSYQKSQFLYLTSQLITGIGDQLYSISIAILVYQQTGSSFQLGLTFAVYYGGTLVGYFLMPCLKGRFEHINIMRGTDLLSAVFVLLLAFVPIVFSWVLLFLLGCLRSINRPFSRSIILKLSSNETEIKKLNADLQTINTLSMIFGFILGGVFAGTQTISIALVLDGFSFVVCVWLIGKIKLKSEVSNEKETSTNSTKDYFDLIFNVRKRVKNDKIVLSILLPNSLALGLVVVFNNQLITLISSHNSNQIYYVICEYLMAMGIMYSAYLMRRSKLLNLSSVQIWLGAGFFTGFCYLIASSIPSLVVVLVVLMISAVFDGLSNIAQMNILHHRVSADYMEQLFSLRFLLVNIVRVALSLVIGFLIQKHGIYLTFSAIGIFICLIMIFCYLDVKKQEKTISC